MKTALWGLVMVIAGAALFGLGWFSRSWFNKTPGVPAPPHDGPMVSYVAGSPGSAPTRVPPAPMHSPFMTASERQQLFTARQTALLSNPDLAAEYKSIIADLQAQQGKIDAAMIKVDPKVEAILAKLKAFRQPSGFPITQGAPNH